MSKLPTIIRNILIETYLDFKDIDLGDDVSKVNLKNFLTEINDGKDEINIFESSVLFEFFYNGYNEFLQSKDLDNDRLKSDTTNYYNELHKQYYDDIHFQTFDRGNSTALIIMRDSINCENFILIDWIKRNFDIIYFGNDFNK